MTTVSKCPECKKDFPEHLIHLIHIANCPHIEDGHYPMCPLCALKVRNNAHGFPEDLPFEGTIANEYWKEATEYARKNH